MKTLFIDVDSLRADHVGRYGYEGETTPNIDALIDDGVAFARGYVANSPCMPSRAALTSGRYGIANGVETHGQQSQLVDRPENRTDWAGSWTENEPSRPWWTLPEAFFQTGTRTIGVSSFPRHPAPWFYHVWHQFRQPQEPDEEMTTEWGHVSFQTPRAEAVTDETIAALESHDGSEFFAYAQYWDPHAPYNRSQEEIDRFRDVDLPPHPTAEGLAEHRRWDTLRGATQEGIESLEDLDELVSAYDAEIHYADRHVGRLLDYLRETGQYEETLIVLSGDHGEEFGEHGLYREHWSTHDGTQRVPMVIKPPSSTQFDAGFRDHLITNVDFAPTILDYADLEPPERWQGRSLRPILESADAGGRDEIVFDHGLYTAQRAIRTDRWKLIRTYHPGMWGGVLPEWQLYDMREDPWEQDDVAEANPEVVETLRKRMVLWAESHRTGSTDPLERVAERGPSGYNSFADQFEGLPANES
ncbi:MAG: sulfatase [Haloferacaceae archaeon]